MIIFIVKHCLICTITPSKRVRKLIGAQRSNVYAPAQCIVVDSAFLPRSTHGYSKALIIVDSCTGFVIIYPSQNLLASTVRRHFLTYLCSHPLPEVVKSDHGGEFRRDLEGFFANYGIQLDGSMAYAKGSTSAAESAIAVCKGALRQLCLAHTATWPELLPTLLQAINSQGLYGTTTSRAQLYFSPYSWQNSVKLNKMLFPEQLFCDNHEKMKFIINKRQENLKKRQIPDSTSYQVGNLVFGINVPSSKTENGSNELKMTVEGLYYCKKVFPRHLRLVGVFNGKQRSLPRELCQKVGINQLAELQFQLKSHHLQRISDNMMRANRFVGPDNSRTWQFLMDNRPPISVQPEENDQDVDQPQIPDKSVAQVDIFGDNTENKRPRTTRSGHVYTMSLSPRSILLDNTRLVNTKPDGFAPDSNQTQASARAINVAKSRGLVRPSNHLGKPSLSACQDTPSSATVFLGTITPQSPAREEISNLDPSAKKNVPHKKKSVSWNTNLQIKLFHEYFPAEDSVTYQQVCFDENDHETTAVVYIMCHAATLDFSMREFFYSTHHTKPWASNVIEREDFDEIYS
jgi:hypothetical protein